MRSAYCVFANASSPIKVTGVFHAWCDFSLAAVVDSFLCMVDVRDVLHRADVLALVGAFALPTIPDSSAFTCS